MILINLLPQEQRYRIRQRKISDFISSLSVLLIILAMAFLGGVFGLKMLLSSHLSNLEKQFSQINQKAKKMEAEQKKLTEFNSSLDLLSKFSEKQVPWVETLSEIARSTPSDVQITNISSDLSKAPKMTIRGFASSRRSVAKFTEKLEISENFSQVKFNSSDLEKTSEEATAKCTFEITLNLDKLAKLVQPAQNKPVGNQSTNAATNQIEE